MKYPKKLIEVALPLDDINEACVREKSIRHGHPSTLHLWWARRPLAAARAVLFAQMVNDPGGERGYGAYPGQTKADALKERERLFAIVRELVKWESTTNEKVLEQARTEIRKSWVETCKLTGENPDKLPPFLDPFAGGGSIPLEAQRLGLEAHASDLNPVAVMISKALLEIPPKFAGRKPIGPIPLNEKEQIDAMEDWSGAKGLAEDVRRYGRWMRDEAFKRIGYLYPQVDLPKEYGAGKANVIAWLWARTVASPNPACKGVHIPLVRSFWLSTKDDKKVWIEPQIAKDKMSYSFVIRAGKGKPTIEGTVNRNGAICLLSQTPVPFNYIRSEAKAGRMSQRLMAVVVECKSGRIYLPASDDMERIAKSADPRDIPDTDLPKKALGFRIQEYGMTKHRHLFTSRQLVAMSTFSDLVSEVRQKIMSDAKTLNPSDGSKGLMENGVGAKAYAEAIAIYLSMGVSRMANTLCTIARWTSSREQTVTAFARQAIPMTWDFPDVNPFAGAAGDFVVSLSSISEAILNLPVYRSASVTQRDAMAPFENYVNRAIISTDPPYYDNIGYADLSDFFYVWLRRSLRSIFPELFSTLLVPKAQELIASPFRHGGKDNAETFFINGMSQAVHNIETVSHPAIPVTIYYAFKQAETDSEGTTSTGWETFLEAVIRSGFAITGTWPMRTELSNRMVGADTNALASSIVLVCRKRPADTPTVPRKQFLRELDESLPEALEAMIGGTEGASPIAPVDLAQAAIGPGMAVFSQYPAVLEADGKSMSVHTVLKLINKAIEEYFTHAESDMDSDTRFCIDWFQQYGFKAGAYGEADVLARAKGTSVGGLSDAGVVEAGAGKVRLLKVSEYSAEWNPEKDARVPIWEACHQLSRALRVSESEAGALLAKMPEKTERIRQLAYRLYTLCEKKGWAEEARIYNELIVSWHGVSETSHKVGHVNEQTELNI